MKDVKDDILFPHILPQYRKTFCEMMANKKATDIVFRFRGVRDPFRELRRLFWSGGRNHGKSLIVTKPLVPKKTEQQKKKENQQYIWFEELSNFEGEKRYEKRHNT